jgi:hypothetical protein
VTDVRVFLTYAHVRIYPLGGADDSIFIAGGMLTPNMLPRPGIVRTVSW